MLQKKNTTMHAMDGIQVSHEGRVLTEGRKIAQGGYTLKRGSSSDDYTRRVSSKNPATVPPPPTKVK